MKFQALFFLLLLTCMCLSLAQGSYGNCCLRYSKGAERLVIGRIKEYRMQETDGDCNLRAVVVVLKKRVSDPTERTVCADPSNNRIRILVERLEASKIRTAH